MDDTTVRKSRSSQRVTHRKKRAPALSAYLTYEEKESLKMRRRLKQRLKNTKSTMGDILGHGKKSKSRTAPKKLPADRKGQMAKQRRQQRIENENRHLLKKILKLHFRKGDASTGTAEAPAAAGGGGKGTVRFHRHADRRTSYMRQRYENLTRISQENKRMIGKLLNTKPQVETELDEPTRQKLGGSMVRGGRGHLGVMRTLGGGGGGGGGSSGTKTRRQRPKSAPVNRREATSEGKHSAPAGRMMYERSEPGARSGQAGKTRARPATSSVHLSRRPVVRPETEDDMIIEDEEDLDSGGEVAGALLSD